MTDDQRKQKVALAHGVALFTETDAYSDVMARIEDRIIQQWKQCTEPDEADALRFMIQALELLTREIEVVLSEGRQARKELTGKVTPISTARKRHR